MSKILIPEDLKGKELSKFLMENKAALIAQKKSCIIKFTEPIACSPGLIVNNTKATGAKAVNPSATSVHVKVVANAANWLDSQYDLLIDDCWKASIKGRKDMIPHLHDHVHEIGAEVGDVTDIYSQDISLRDLGLDMKGTTQCLIFETEIQKSYNEIVFNKYKNGRVKQHSIGLSYVKLALAINDEENEKEFDFWTKYYERIINKEFADESGFFWVVQEIKLLENSGVLFGANELTPTLEVKSGILGDPANASHEEPHHKFDLSSAIKKTKFFN